MAARRAGLSRRLAAASGCRLEVVMSRGAKLIELGGDRRRLGSRGGCPEQLSSGCGAVMAGAVVAAAVMESLEL